MRTVITRPLAGEPLEQLEDLRRIDTNYRRGDKPHGHRSHPTDAPWRVLCRMPGPVAAPIPLAYDSHQNDSERSADFAKRITFPMTRGEGPEAGSAW